MLFTLLRCPKWCLRNEACEFPFVKIIQWTQQYLRQMSWPSCPHPVLSIRLIRSLIYVCVSVYYVIFISENFFFLLAVFLVVWPFWMNLSNCWSATATWQITGDMLNLMVILVTTSFLMNSAVGWVIINIICADTWV